MFSKHVSHLAGEGLNAPSEGGLNSQLQIGIWSSEAFPPRMTAGGSRPDVSSSSAEHLVPWLLNQRAQALLQHMFKPCLGVVLGSIEIENSRPWDMAAS